MSTVIIVTMIAPSTIQARAGTSTVPPVHTWGYRRSLPRPDRGRNLRTTGAGGTERALTRRTDDTTVGEYSPPRGTLRQFAPVGTQPPGERRHHPRRARKGAVLLGRLHLPELLLEVGDLVAQAGRELELQLLGGGEHLRVELLDEVREVARGRGSQPFPHRGAGGLPLPGARPLVRPAVAALEELGGVDGLPGEHVGDVGDPLAQRRRVDAVLLVVRQLLGPAAVGLLDRLRHRVGHGVGIHVHLARDVTGGAPDGLDEGGGRAQEALLVRVER